MIALSFFKSLLYSIYFLVPAVSFTEIILQLITIGLFNAYFEDMQVCSYPEFARVLGYI